MMVYDVEKRKNGSYSIPTPKFGVIDFYPKSDKILFRTRGNWISGGCNWICNNL